MKNPSAKGAVFLLLVIGALAGPAAAEDVSLERCEAAAASRHPLSGKSPYIEAGERAGLLAENLKYLPRLSLSTKTTRQSDATPMGMLPKNLDQWQATAEASQIIFDGGAVEAQKKAAAAAADIERNQLAVGLESVRSQVRQTFFAIILAESRLAQNGLRSKELADNRERITALFENGVAIQSDIDLIRVEELGARVRDAELQSAREGAVFALSRLTGLSFGPESRFVRPGTQLPAAPAISKERKEYALFRSQEAAQDARRSALRADLFPRISAFVQAGVGEPGLNALETEAQRWWIAGIRGTLVLDNLYSFGASSKKIDAAIGKIGSDEESFILGEEIRLNQTLAEISRLEKTVAIDDGIIALRMSLKAAAAAKAENGMLSVAGLLREINEESIARETKALHEIQLLSAKSELSLIIGNGE